MSLSGCRNSSGTWAHMVSGTKVVLATRPFVRSSAFQTAVYRSRWWYRSPHQPPTKWENKIPLIVIKRKPGPLWNGKRAKMASSLPKQYVPFLQGGPDVPKWLPSKGPHFSALAPKGDMGFNSCQKEVDRNDGCHWQAWPIKTSSKIPKDSLGPLFSSYQLEAKDFQDPQRRAEWKELVNYPKVLACIGLSQERINLYGKPQGISGFLYHKSYFNCTKSISSVRGKSSQ